MSCTTIRVSKRARKQHLKHHCDYDGECPPNVVGNCTPPAPPINGCTLDSECGGATPYCHTRTCVAFRNNGDYCGNTPLCDSGRCICHEAGQACSENTDCCGAACTCGGNDEAGICRGGFSQGFEQVAAGWVGVERVPSGTDGIQSQSGGFLAKVSGSASSNSGFTRWGGYTSVFPQGGYDTSLATSNDPAITAVDQQWDYSSDINQPSCDYRRDFIFTAGKDVTGFCVSASNNSLGWASNPGRNPAALTEAGWYKFFHQFRDEGGVLAVEMILLDPDGDEVKSWTLSEASDLIGTTVGGNRYGWFAINECAFVAIDDSVRNSAN